MTEIAERNATPIADKSDTAADVKRQPKLLDRVRERIRVKHYSRSTEKTYLYWIRWYIHYHGLRHPQEMGAAEVEQFLSHLATAENVSAKTQNQAMHAVLYLYKHVLGVQLPWLDGITRARESKRLPVVLTIRETQALLRHTPGPRGRVRGHRVDAWRREASAAGAVPDCGRDSVPGSVGGALTGYPGPR